MHANMCTARQFTESNNRRGLAMGLGLKQQLLTHAVKGWLWELDQNVLPTTDAKPTKNYANNADVVLRDAKSIHAILTRNAKAMKQSYDNDA
jgi:hypothetical protein